jgi:hypothetical protein
MSGPRPAFLGFAGCSVRVGSFAVLVPARNQGMPREILHVWGLNMKFICKLGISMRKLSINGDLNMTITDQ